MTRREGHVPDGGDPRVCMAFVSNLESHRSHSCSSGLDVAIMTSRYVAQSKRPRDGYDLGPNFCEILWQYRAALITYNV